MCQHFPQANITWLQDQMLCRNNHPSLRRSQVSAAALGCQTHLSSLLFLFLLYAKWTAHNYSVATRHVTWAVWIQSNYTGNVHHGPYFYLLTGFSYVALAIYPGYPWVDQTRLASNTQASHDHVSPVIQLQAEPHPTPVSLENAMVENAHKLAPTHSPSLEMDSWFMRTPTCTSIMTTHSS